ncbi:LEAF RUST 10 DISEASE-RESISTANCE LOCUS RECEPTOR-LIKE PROTEIN KINASE-like 1.1 isoform X3 [Corylus avellana]|uniref:LEAF RUST 10 DISEASE-RESISTANCE LOCUS RECEPTOR-LIKE PROTEIN KINASE-like 1.1 isoform X3 n=1 Tax=Corylus avellana TaxID=13451 RepID=UPI001E206E32|nr:LEAF RUST 10 DISEASE-RESISTANCE LOCUS RECEPTOR-LIKE PROTEIN KINASE-like 1.1 isoform X3 [Corylus avellana]
MASVSLFVFFVLSHFVPLHSAQEEAGYSYTQRCPEFHCGNLRPLGFPFASLSQPECGVFTIECGNPYSTIQLEEGGRLYHVQRISQDNTIHIKDEWLGEQLQHPASVECESLHNLTITSSSFVSFEFFPKQTFFKCNRTPPTNFKRFSCNDHHIYYNSSSDSFPTSLSGCSIIQLPKNPNADLVAVDSPFELLAVEFDLKPHVSDACYKCYQRGGHCKPKPDDKGELDCLVPEKERNRHKLAIAFGVVCPVIFFIMICVFFIIRHHYKKKYASSTMLAKNANSDPSSRSDLEGGSVYYGVPVYSYSELEEATNNFDTEKELGDGGFGIVYYGKLRDGREVAVKRLYEHNYRRVAQFMNEVEILTRLRHKNLVSLYGCTSHRSRQLLLVYEYIPNGTVADHIHGERATLGSLTWPTRMNIAIETATALAYLHASEIIHRDVKTNNILLDKNFCVKVADFGLSRLFPNDVSHVSTAPQGTPGYVDPEYHQCYQLTTKSDVYSFGVVLIELISSLPAVDIARHRHEINLANLAISKIEKSAFHELIDPHLGFESDKEVERMTILVAQLAFQCIQQDKETRPSMDEVLEALKQIQSGNDAPEDQEKGFDDDVVVNVKPPISPESDEVALLKTKQLPPSPISVNTNWTSRSTTPNISS